MSKGSRALSGQRAHWDSWDASRCRPSPCDGRTDSQEDACDAETESNRALSAMEVSNSTLNMQVSNVLDRAFWETEDAEIRE